MTTFYLHIGMNKTASSAIQKCFHENRRKIRAATGVDYAPLPVANHTRFLQVYFQPPGEREGVNAARRRRRDWYEEGYEERFEAFLGYLKRTAKSGRDVLMSGEGATNIPPHELVRLRDIALTHFDRVVILAFVRPLQSFARSAAAQRVTTGRSLDFFLGAPPVPNYRQRFERFFEVFGREAVRLRVFEPAKFVDGDPVHTLLDMMGVERQRLARLRAPAANITPRLTAIKFLSQLNRILRDGAMGDALPPPLQAAVSQGNLGRWLEAGWTLRRNGRPVPMLPPAAMRAFEAMPGPAFVLAREIAESVAEAAAEDSRWMSTVLGRDIAAGDTAIADLPEFASYTAYSDEDVAGLLALVATVDAADPAPFATPGKGEKAIFDARSRRSLRSLAGRRFSLLPFFR